jgi:hypothetical protein
VTCESPEPRFIGWQRSDLTFTSTLSPSPSGEIGEKGGRMRSDLGRPSYRSSSKYEKLGEGGIIIIIHTLERAYTQINLRSKVIILVLPFFIGVSRSPFFIRAANCEWNRQFLG